MLPQKKEGIFIKLSKTNLSHYSKLFFENTFRFIAMMIFINLYMTLFGPANTLVGVAIAVAFMTYPSLDMNISPIHMAFLIFFLLIGSGLSSASTLFHPAIAFLINTSYIIILLLFTSEPSAYKPYMPFLLCFIFCQSVPVQGQELVLRMTGITVCALGTALYTFLMWKKNGYGQEPLSLKEQILHSTHHRGFILRLSFGISVAMLLGTVLHIQKPLWISIVVMSLTQIELKDTLLRIKHRTIGTILGILIFIVVFQYLVPPKYVFILVFLIGYINNFIKEYKYTQILNAVNAINASLVMLDTSTAIENRVMCLLCGILIVLIFYVLHFIYQLLTP